MGAMPVAAEFPFSDLVQHPTRVAAAVEQGGRVLLRRRNAPDLVLSRASELTELAGFTRLLARMLDRVPASQKATVVSEALPWARYLTSSGRDDFVDNLPAVVRDCEELGTFAPLEIYIAEWRNTAAVLADPELAKSLGTPLPHPLGTPVNAP
jgi:hypothetical protein